MGVKKNKNVSIATAIKGFYDFSLTKLISQRFTLNKTIIHKVDLVQKEHTTIYFLHTAHSRNTIFFQELLTVGRQKIYRNLCVQEENWIYKALTFRAARLFPKSGTKYSSLAHSWINMWFNRGLYRVTVTFARSAFLTKFLLKYCLVRKFTIWFFF